MVKPAAGAGAGAALRKDAEAAVLLDRNGRHDEALALVDELAAGHAGSSFVLYAAGHVHYAQARRAKAAGEKKEVVAHHLTTAHVYLTEAKRLVPNCIDISVLLSRVLLEASRHGEAGAELRRAIGIHSPVDPAENNVDMYGGDACTMTTKDERVENSRETARFSFQAIGEWICNNDVALVVRKAFEVELDANDRRGMAQALRTANDLARRYPQSSRAQLFRAYMKLNFARSLDATIDRRPFLDHIRDDMPDTVNLSNGSLVLSMFRAKLCFVLGSYEDAYLECLVAFGTEEPVDPKLEDVPPGSVDGEESADRLSSIYREFSRLIGRLLWVAKDYWNSMTVEEQDSFLSVRLIKVHKYYHESYESDHWAARTISDALSFVKKTKSWRFWICPYCVGKKLPVADSLLRHLCSKHPAEKDLLPKLHLILHPKLTDDTCVDDDYSLDEMITVGRDSEDHYFFQFKNTDNIFEHLFLPASSVTEEESFDEIRGEKCKLGTEVLEKMKRRLKDLPTEKLSAEFHKAHREIQELWCDFLTISMLDYRTVILPLVETFLWNELIKETSGDNAASKSIDNADIDTVFPDVIYDPGSNALVQNFFKLSDGNEDHKSGDDQETENMKPSSLDKTLVDDEKGEESGPLVEDRNSGAMPVEDKKSSDPTIYMDESRISKLAARIANVELGSSGQSVGEMGSTSSHQPSFNVFNKNNSDKVLFSLRIIIQSLCNLKHFRDDFLTRALEWNPSSDNPCIADILYGIFFAWERYIPYPTVDLLTSVKTILCRLADDSTIYEKVGENFASETVLIILNGLHMSETSSSFRFNSETEGQVVNPIMCGDCICPTHNLFGINFDAQMSCRCGKCSDKYLYTTLFHILDAGSPQTTKMKSFADLRFRLDEQFCKDNSCKHCETVENVDLFLSNTPHFFTIGLNWVSGSTSQDTLSEVLACITSPLDAEFFCGSACSATKYIVTSMICYADERYVCFARDEDNWLIYDSETIEAVDTWEHLLESFKDCKLQPEVLFFEVIK